MCSFKFWTKSIQKKIIFLIIYLKYLRKTNTGLKTNFLNLQKYDFNL